MFLSAKKPFKKDSNDYIINNLLFRVTCTILRNLQNKNLQTLPENFQFSITFKPSKTQQIDKIDLD